MLSAVLRMVLPVGALVVASALAVVEQSIAGPQVTSGDPPKEKSETKDGQVDPKWLDRMGKNDRALLDELIGFAPPAIPEDVTWITPRPVTFDSLRGNVVVIQSWTSKSTVGQKMPSRTARALDGVDANSVTIIAMHTPEGAENVATYLERQPLDMPVLIDSKGAYCDALGIYKDPTNVVIDKQGNIRYAGLNFNGLKLAVEKLVAEPFEPSIRPNVKTDAAGDQAASKSAGDYPPIEGSIRSAADWRGKKAPEFFVQQWVTSAPQLEGKVVIIDFWATWCGPCVAAIPHMNDLQTHFGDKVCCIGISDEPQDRFEKGMDSLKSKKNISLKTFKYAVALDPSRKMSMPIQIQGIPHVIVMSTDWVVRWQGHPSGLQPETIQQIIDADPGMSGGSTGAKKGPKRNRWTGR